jgi:frataxin
VLTVEVEGTGVFVLNKHAPLRQLWLSSPVSGASHYTHDAATGAWRSTRGGDDLATTLEAELEDAAGSAIALDYRT